MPSKKHTPRRIFTDNSTFREQYQSLQAGDVFVGRLRLKASEEALLLDLEARGVVLFPSATAQMASRSKAFQAMLFGSRMVPQTTVIHDRHDLLEAVNTFGGQQVSRVVTKQDRGNAGMGIHVWSNIEDVHNQATFSVLPFPFVLQPYMHNCRDIRVVILGDYHEAYWRSNPHNFRNNLHCGGRSSVCELTPKQLAICREVMNRGGFPYAHIDLMVTESGESYLAEINLRGGIRGAVIETRDYLQRIEQIHQDFLHQFQDK